MIHAEYCRNAGIGNKLFPISRMYIASKLTHLPMVDPIWVSPRGAGITRGGIDYSRVLGKIFLFNNFKPIPQARSSWNVVNTFKPFSTKPLIKVNSLDDFLVQWDYWKDRVDYIFSWNANHTFHELMPHRDEILLFLKSISRIDFNQFELPTPGDLVLNLRLGNDFLNSQSTKQGYRKNPNDFWRIAVDEVVRNQSVRKIYCVSDGTSDAIKALVDLDVVVVNHKRAIEDLMFCAHARTIVGTGSSSFSAWGSFLSNAKIYGSKESTFEDYGLVAEHL
jgi:hypothetical protein